VGIKNGGATCYMNSLFQQLFMQPSIRAFVLAGAEVPQAERRDSVFYQLQVGLQTPDWYLCWHIRELCTSDTRCRTSSV
jgi:hypothetical protein